MPTSTPMTELWSETVHDESGQYRGARLLRRGDTRALVLLVGDRHSTLDVGDARSLFAALGEALQDGER